MAAERPVFNQKSITSNFTTITAGNFSLQWAPNFITGQLPIQRVEVLIDAKDGPVKIQLPASSDVKSKGVLLIVSAINVTDENTVAVWAVNGEKISGNDSRPVTNQSGVMFVAYAAGGWGF